MHTDLQFQLMIYVRVFWHPFGAMMSSFNIAILQPCAEPHQHGYVWRAQALALGADAVLVGRPVMFGLALDGQSGVERILDLLKRELELAMVLAGCSSLKDISKDMVMTYPPSML